jgi:negative regulator of sigma E activity
MRDEDLDRELSALLDGELPPERARLLREEIEADPQLRERLAEFEAASERLRALPQSELPAGFGARLRERIGEPERGNIAGPARSMRSFSRWGVPLAAALAAGLVAVWLMQPVSDSAELDPPELQEARVRQQPGARPPRPQLRLPDQEHQEQDDQLFVQDPAAPNRLEPVRGSETDPDDSSDEEVAIALELETLRDFDLIQELDLLEALLIIESAEEGPG